MKKIYSLGFTLLELLVVISIIGILVGVVSVSYSQSQKKARDIKRKSDLKALQNCLEQAFPITNSYPTISLNLLTHALSADCNGDGTADVTIVDPVNANGCVYTISKQGYSVIAPLEGSNCQAGTGYTINNLQ